MPKTDGELFTEAREALDAVVHWAANCRDSVVRAELLLGQLSPSEATNHLYAALETLDQIDQAHLRAFSAILRLKSRTASEASS